MRGRAFSSVAGTALAATLLAVPAAATPNVAPLSAVDAVFDVLPAPARAAILTPEQVTVANLPAGVDGPNIAPTPFAISPVPEPLSWAMMIAGFGLLGVALRHRRSRYLA